MSDDAYFCDTGGANALHVMTAPYSLQWAGFDSPQSVSWRRIWVKSPYVQGAFVAQATADIVKENMTVLVGGADQAAIQTNLSALIQRLVSQYVFEFHVVVGNASYGWSCLIPDYSVSFDKRMVIGRQAAMEITLYRQPVPLAGSSWF